MAQSWSDAVRFVEERTPLRPCVAVVLGSGLAGFAAELDEAVDIPYSEIPGWPVSSVEGHAGQLVLGVVGGVPVAVLAGRVHLYEGYSAAEVAFPVRAIQGLGAKKLIVTNAAGGIRAGFRPGDLVLITDHINLQGTSPLEGDNCFVDMTNAYCPELRRLAQRTADGLGSPVSEGVYAAVRGPNYETPAEIRYLKAIGADLVGMSTAMEVIAARERGMDVLGISCVANAAAGLGDHGLRHEEVLVRGAEAQEKLGQLLREVIPAL